MKQDYTEDELLKIARSIQQIVHGNTSGAHHEAFKHIINYTKLDSKAKLLDSISHIMDISDEFGNFAEYKDFLASIFGSSSLEYKTIRYALTFRIPTLKFIVEELKAIISEFDGLEIDDKNISVIMGPYFIEGVEFGRFKIKFNFNDVGKMYPELYPPKVTALEPNYPENNDDINPHPHVNYNNICIGDGERAIARSVRGCRIYDYFTMIDAVLKTLGPEPYISILAWTGEKCRDCGLFYEPGAGVNCEKCDKEFCENCTFKCCSLSFNKCGRCSSEFSCRHCGVYICAECVRVCIKCRDNYCEGHVKDDWHRCRIR